MHTEHPRQPARTLLLGVGADPRQAALARAEGADLIDAGAASEQALTAIRASLPGVALWTGSPGDPVGADRLAAEVHPGGVTGPADQVPAAAVIATAAVCTWLGAPLVRSRHTRAVRHAIDMTASIAGNRPPSRTVRGLA
jgi:dihydropteroate synthase